MTGLKGVFGALGEALFECAAFRHQFDEKHGAVNGAVGNPVACLVERGGEGAPGDRGSPLCGIVGVSRCFLKGFRRGFQSIP